MSLVSRHLLILAAQVALLAAGLLRAAAAQHREPPPPAMPPTMLQRAKADPCGLVAAALRAHDGADRSCPRFREENGDLIVDLVLRDGKKSVSVLERGRRCPGDYVGADKRPGKEARWVRFLAVTFQSTDEVTLKFDSWFTIYELSSTGVMGGEIGGCLSGDSGRVRLADGAWVTAGARDEGCSQ